MAEMTKMQKRAFAGKKIWVVEGVVTDTDAHEGAKLGDKEWQFSDGPAGERGSSSDYLSLEEGLRDHALADLIFDFAPTPQKAAETPEQSPESLNVRLHVMAGFCVSAGLHDGPLTRKTIAGLIDELLADAGGSRMFIERVEIAEVYDDDERLFAKGDTSPPFRP